MDSSKVGKVSRRYGAKEIMAKRLCRAVKYEEAHLNAYANAAIAKRELAAYFRFYNNQSPHQTLGYRTPASLFHTYRRSLHNGPKQRRCQKAPMVVSCAEAAGLSLNLAPILSNQWGSTSIRISDEPFRGTEFNPTS